MGETEFTDAVVSVGGNVSKAEIFKIVHERLMSMGFAKHILSIDNELRDCLYELSNDVNVLLTAATATLTAQTATVTKPSGLKYMYIAAIDGGNVLEFGGIEEYERSIENADTPSYGDPTKIHEFAGDLYVYDPICDSADTVRIYGVLEEDDVDDIDLHDRCREALVWGVLYRLYIGGELNPAPADTFFDRKMTLVQNGASNSLAMYERAKACLERSSHKEPYLVKYRDI